MKVEDWDDDNGGFTCPACNQDIVFADGRQVTHCRLYPGKRGERFSQNIPNIYKDEKDHHACPPNCS